MKEWVDTNHGCLIKLADEDLDSGQQNTLDIITQDPTVRVEYLADGTVTLPFLPEPLGTDILDNKRLVREALGIIQGGIYAGAGWAQTFAFTSLSESDMAALTSFVGTGEVYYFPDTDTYPNWSRKCVFVNSPRVTRRVADRYDVSFTLVEVK